MRILTVAVMLMLAGVAQAGPAARCTVHVAAAAQVADAMRTALTQALADAHTDLAGSVDVAVVGVRVVRTGTHIAVTAEVRAVVSDPDGKIVSLASTTARLEVPPHDARTRSLSRVREQALIEAARELAHPLETHARVAQRQ